LDPRQDEVQGTGAEPPISGKGQHPAARDADGYYLYARDLQTDPQPTEGARYRKR